MFLVPTQQHHGFLGHHASSLLSSSSSTSLRLGSLGSGAIVNALLSSPTDTSMDRSAPEFSQTGLPSPYPSSYGDTKSEGSADHASAAHYATQPEARSNAYSTSATPTSEYSVYPQSARSGTFPEHIQRSYHPASSHSASSGSMAQPQTSALSPPSWAFQSAPQVLTVCSQTHPSQRLARRTRMDSTRRTQRKPKTWATATRINHDPTGARRTASIAPVP
jgi:hypothetical protein